MKDYEEMSLEELCELQAELTAIISKKRENRLHELIDNLERAYLTLREEYPEYHAIVTANIIKDRSIDGCLYGDVDLYDVLDEYFFGAG